MSLTIRHARRADFGAIVALNEADLSHLSPLTVVSLERLAGIAAYFAVADVDGGVAGFLLAIQSDALHESVNFRWFQARYAKYVYIDRVVVASDARRAGIASLLYEDLELDARAWGAPLIACEINVRPPNPHSLAFHDRHGFIEVGAQNLDGGAKTVSMRVKQLG